MPKLLKSAWRKLWYSSASKKTVSSFTFSWSYCTDIEIFSFIYLLLFSFYFKLTSNNFYKMPININQLGNLGMPSYVHPKWYYQLVENVCLYLQAENQLNPPRFSGDISKICKRLVLSTLGMSSYVNPKR